MSRFLIGPLVAIVIVVFLSWYIQTPLPDEMEDKVKVTLIDAAMRTYGHVVRLLSRVGVMEAFSDLDRRLADIFVILMTTGRPWIQTTDPGLEIRELKTDKNSVRMRMYEPVTPLQNLDKRPVLVYFHGGGFSLFSIDSYDALTRRLARDSGVVVVSVNYRLSPQNPFPTPLDDCLEAVEYIIDHSSALKLDPQRLAVGGDSAGGNLAASVSLLLRGRIKAQLLLVPALQLLTFNTTSVQENKQYFSSTVNNLFQVAFWTNYIGCGKEYVHDIIHNNHTSPELKRSVYAQNVDQNKWLNKVHIRGNTNSDLSQKVDFGRTDISQKIIDKITNALISPLMSTKESLRGLPRAYVMTAGYDIIRDDGIMYAERLRDAGVPVIFVNHRTGFHNALTFSEGPLSLNVAKQIVHDMVTFLQQFV